MLLTCQPELSGSQPFLIATVAVAGTPPVMPHRWLGITCRISSYSYCREASDSSPPGSITCLSSVSWSAAVV